MSYLTFHLVFIIPPILFFGFIALRNDTDERKTFLRSMWTLCLLAFVWTTPWDNYLVANNIWSYGLDRVLFTIGYVPIEEYAFFFLQTILSSLFLYFLSLKIKFKYFRSNSRGLAISLLYALGFFAGVIFLFYERTLYMGLILSWAMPVCFLQWSLGKKYLIANKKLCFLSIIIPTLYLWAADWYAIYDNIWTITDKTIIGVKILDVLPIEEAMFFLVTNIMVAQGVILFIVMKEERAKMFSFIKRARV